MLAGLIFATSQAEGSDALTATLPFGGGSLIEFQARLLTGLGASQILIAVGRITPELLGAASRIGRRGVAVDVVRSAAEAAAKVHPLARVVVLADGLVTTEETLSPFAGEGGDLLLVAEDADGLERLDASSRWAGIARVGAQRLADTASLPRDYDFLSALLRVTAQHGADKLPLAAGSARQEHGVEHDAPGLARRGRAVFASLGGQRVRWIDRWVLTPLARLVLPPLVARGASPAMLGAAGGGIGLAGLFALWRGWPTVGLAGVGAAIAALTLAGMLAWLRGEDGDRALADRVVEGLAALALLLAGFGEDAVRGTVTGSVLAVTLMIAAALVERIARVATPRRWWAGPAAYPLLLVPFAAAGQVLTGLAILALYAAACLWNGIDTVRADT